MPAAADGSVHVGVVDVGHSGTGVASQSAAGTLAASTATSRNIEALASTCDSDGDDGGDNRVGGDSSDPVGKGRGDEVCPLFFHNSVCVWCNDLSQS